MEIWNKINFSYIYKDKKTKEVKKNEEDCN